MSLTTRLSGAGLALAAVLAATPAVAQTSASDLRSALNTTLAEHVFLAGAATDAALGGRSPQFSAAASALDGNSVALSKTIGSVYGAGAETAFLALWRKHVGFFVDYTTGVAKKDMAMQEKAVKDLLRYADDFGAFLASANPNLPKDVVAGLVRDHVVSLKAVVDAQGKGDWATAYSKLRDAAGHMRMIADPLAAAIGKQFPEKYAMK